MKSPSNNANFKATTGMQSGGAHRTLNEERSGTVLLIVAVIVMLLSLLAYKYMQSMQTEHMAIAVQGDRLLARHSAHSARDLLRFMVKQPQSVRDSLGGLTDNPSYFAGRTDLLLSGIVQTTEIDPALRPTIGMIGYRPPVDDTLPTSVEPHSRYGVSNESDRLHLRTILAWEMRNAGDGFQALMQLPGMDETTAESILDWLDSDQDARANGAEADFYATLANPVAPRNSIPFDLEELLLVQGVTHFKLFGGSKNRTIYRDQRVSNVAPNASPGTAELPTYSSGTTLPESAPPWSDFLTTYSGERNESFTGQPRIFVNQPSLDELHRLLSERISTSVADFVVLFRQFGASDDRLASSTTSELPGVTIDFSRPASVSIESLVDLMDSTVTVPATDDAKEIRLPSPLDSKSTKSPEDLVRILDQITVTSNAQIRGRINVNTASETVLKTIPGFSETTVDGVVQARPVLTSPDQRDGRNPARLHPMWLLLEGLVDKPTMRKTLPFLTCGGDVIRAHIWGRIENDSPTFHYETVLDGTTAQCESLLHRELTISDDAITVLADDAFSSLTPESLTTPSVQF